MKIIMRETARVFPGKMSEALELLKNDAEIDDRLDSPTTKHYRHTGGKGDYLHTFIADTEFASFSEIENILEKAGADPEYQQQMGKWDKVLESLEIDFYVPMQ